MVATNSKSRTKQRGNGQQPLTGTVVKPRVVRLSAEPDVDDERNVLFSIGDTEYTIAARPSASIGLKYLHLVRTEGQDVGVGWMLEELLGIEGYQALMDYPQLSSEDLGRIIEIAGETLMGSIETPKA